MHFKTSLKYKNRILLFQQFLESKNIEACLVSDPVDLLYLTGLLFSVGTLIVSKNRSALFVDSRYFQVAQEKSGITTYLLSDKELQEFTKECALLYFDSSFTTVDQYERLKKIFKIPLHPFPECLKELRAIKDEEEIKALSKSAALLNKAYDHIIPHLKEGVTERAIAKEFEIRALQEGAAGLAFEPIIAFGKNTSMPHYRAGDATLKKGDIILIDVGVVVDAYHSDMTRMLHFGTIDPQLVHMDSVVRSSQAAALKMCRPGERIGSLDEEARRVMRESGLEHLFVHSLGHGVGLQIHEFPRLKYDGVDKDVILRRGMVITIEPGLYLPGVGGVRHEDTVVITDEGYQNLTGPQKVFDV